MKNYYFLYFILLLIFASCENEDESIDFTNKILFSEIKTTSSYETAQIESEIYNNSNSIITQYGHCWSEKPNADISNYFSEFTNIHKGIFISNPDILKDNTLYYTRAYYKIGNYIRYSDETTFKTTEIGVPTIVTLRLDNITAYSVRTGGLYVFANGSEIIEQGVCWNKSGNPTIADSVKVDTNGIKTFQLKIENLEFDTEYYLRAYAVNEKGAGYGKTLTFKTESGIPIFRIQNIEVTPFSASVKTEFWDDGGLEIIDRGICWNTEGDPSIEDSVLNTPHITSQFITFSIENLNVATNYYVRDYVITDIGVFYGDDISFTTKDGAPKVLTYKIDRVVSSTAKGGGEVLSEEGFSVTSRGVCWNLTGSPTVNDSKTVNGSGVGMFESELDNMQAGQTYYIRAYATNEKGTSYGIERVLNMDWYELQVQDYDGNWYSTVTIGNQVWLRENLETTHYANGEAIPKGNDYTSDITAKYYYVGNEYRYKEEYGLLYSWAAAMHGAVATYENPSGVQGVCPDGWHLPSIYEWQELFDFVGGSSIAGGKLKEAGYDHWSIPNYGATNEFGFTALPAGRGFDADLEGSESYLHSTSNNTNYDDVTRTISFGSGREAAYKYDMYKSSGASVRCIKDE